MKLIQRFLLLLSVVLFFTPLPLSADDGAKAKERVEQSTTVLEEIISMQDKNIPDALLGKVAAVAIFPGVMKAGFIVGGKYGKGLVLRRLDKGDEWSAPAFYSIAAGSFGWQVGAQATDLVLLIRSEKGLKALLRNELTLGGDVSVAAGPVGRKAGAGVDTSFKTEIWTYSRSKGLFAGVSLEGAKITPLYDYNKAYYGETLTSKDILIDDKVKKAPPEAMTLIGVLKKHADPAAFK